MKKTDPETIQLIRDHALSNPADTYSQIAASFGVSLITVKRYCSDLGRSSNQRNRRSLNGAFDPNRLWAQVDRKPGKCWLWTGCTNSSGYGFIFAQGRNQAVHRLAYQLTKGTLPEGLELDHLCRNRTCCNPDHLEPVTRVENMTRAGLIPPRRTSRIDTLSCDFDTQSATDTHGIGPATSAHDGPLPHIKAPGLRELIPDTGDSLIPVSIEGSALNGDRDAVHPRPALNTPRPRSAGPYAPLCTMAEPTTLELVRHPDRQEGPRGTKKDLGIDDWAVTEFGSFWWQQSDEDLQNRSIYVQTEAQREAGEFLHWYHVQPLDADKIAIFMSARTGPEACVKVERTHGRGWADSWEYIRPDPHRGPFFTYNVSVLHAGRIFSLYTVARTANDAISMIESVWGPGHAVSCTKGDRPENGRLELWVNRWRELLTRQRENILRTSGESLVSIPSRSP